MDWMPRHFRGDYLSHPSRALKSAHQPAAPRHRLALDRTHCLRNLSTTNTMPGRGPVGRQRIGNACNDHVGEDGCLRRCAAWYDLLDSCFRGAGE